MVEPQYFTAKEAAVHLGLSYAMVTKLVRQKRIPSYPHTPKCIRINRADLDAYMAMLRTAPAAAPSPRVRPQPLKMLKPKRMRERQPASK